MSANSTELAPCPFCGGRELGLNRPSDQRTGPHWHDWFIRCYGCHVETSEYPTEAQAVAAWNTRATPSPATGQVERMPLMFAAFRTTVSEPRGNGKKRYAMEFEFPTLDALHAADDEWRALSAPKTGGAPSGT